MSDSIARRGWRIDSFDAPARARLEHFAARLIVKPVIDGMLRCAFSITIENGPLPARSILVSRHLSYWDPMLVALCDPRIKPLGNAYWFEHGPFPWYVSNVRALPNNFRGVLGAVKHLRQGGIVWMAPAGYETDDALPPKEGASRLAVAAQASIVPITIEGASHLPRLTLPRRPRQPVHVRYGSPRTVTRGERERIWREVLLDARIGV